VSFVLPLGYSFNLDGSMMYMTFASLFIAQSYGIHLDIGTQITMLLVLMLTSKGIAGVPNEPFHGAPHALELSTWLTAKNPNPDRRNKIDIGISADQIAANFVGAATSLPSLELATMPQTHKENQDGLNEGYYSHCSYSSATQPLPAEINPRNVLNRLFFRAGRTGTSGEADPLA